MDKILEKAYNKNKKIWHADKKHYGKELHHVYSRVGAYLVCMRFFVPADKCHHDKWWLIKFWREQYFNDRAKFEQNYVRKQGCKADVFKECASCFMPRVENEINNKIQN